METTIVQPGSTPSIYSTGDHGHRGHDDHFRETRLDADFRGLINQGERNGDRTTNGVQVTGDRVNTVGAAGALAAGRTNELVQAAACRTDQLLQGGFGDAARDTCAATRDVTAALGTGFTASALASCKTDDGVQLVGKDAVTLAKDGLIALQAAVGGINSGVATGFAAQSVLATTIGNAQAVLSNAIGNAAAVQATANYNGLTVLGERIRAELGAKQDAGFAAATLVAFQNKSDSDAKAAKCCCDAEMTAARNFAALSALIVSDGNTTRALINQNTIDDLRAFKASIPRGIAITVPVTA